MLWSARAAIDCKGGFTKERTSFAVWILNYCMLLPGPDVKQLATYIGWLMHRTLGGILAGAPFRGTWNHLDHGALGAARLYFKSRTVLCTRRFKHMARALTHSRACSSLWAAGTAKLSSSGPEFVGFMAAYRDPGTLMPMMAEPWAGCSRPGSPAQKITVGTRGRGRKPRGRRSAPLSTHPAMMALRACRTIPNRRTGRAHRLSIAAGRRQCRNCFAIHRRGSLNISGHKFARPC